MDDGVAELSTRLLRESSDPVWVRLRELLQARGLDPGQVALANLFPDDTNMEFGIVVTPDRRVYEFDLTYGKGDLRRHAATATISGWRDRTEDWRDSAQRGEIEAAFDLLSHQSA